MQTQGLTMISVRDFLRGYKATVNSVMASGFPVVVTHRQTPQVAIVSIKTLQEEKHRIELEKTRNLLVMAKEAEILAKKYKIKYPKDLSINHDKYTWGPYE
ncbi:hypothetical protein HY085_01140 [Candidatus Gottesmanbacteria bacterium]|nr:hypothetical protein [Candidatus Gottesmanbacteria bacterium]